jgi:hypothetical protein
MANSVRYADDFIVTNVCPELFTIYYLFLFLLY